MKQIVSIFSILLILMGSVGISIHSHFCHNTQDLIVDAAIESHDHCGHHSSKDGFKEKCCIDLEAKIALADYHPTKSLIHVDLKSQIDLLYSTLLINYDFPIAQISTYNLNLPPPVSISEKLSLLSSYLI